MKQFWKDTFYKNGYLLIAAAWLFTLSFIFSNYWSYTSSPNGVKSSLEKYIRHNEESFESLLKDSTLLRKLVSQQQSAGDLEQITEKKYGVFLYRENTPKGTQLVFWNTQVSLPTQEILEREDNHYMTTLSNGQYEVLRKRVNVQNKPILAICLLPVHRQYFLSSDYLQNGFVDHPNLEHNYSIADIVTSYPVQSSNGAILFYLQPRGDNIYSNDWITLLLRMMGSVLFLFFIHNIAISISKTRGPLLGVSFITVILVGLRILSYYFQIPINFRQFELFDPQIYGTSSVLKSLGDLLINSVLFFWLVLFAKIQFSRKAAKLDIKNIFFRWIVIVALSCIMILMTLVCGHIIRSLVADSQISFDVTNFFSLNIYSIFGFLVLCCVSLGYFILSQVLLQILNTLTRGHYYVKALTLSVIGLVVLSGRINNPFALFELSVLIWLLLYVYLMSKTELGYRQISFPVANALFWLFIFSASIAGIIIFENRTREIDLRMRTAEKLAMQTNPSNERLLNITIQSFSNNFFLNNLPRLKSANTNKDFKDSLINANFTAYLNKYDTELFFYDENEKPISSNESRTYDTLNTIYRIQAKATTVPGLRYFETSYDNISYIYLKEIKDSSDQMKAYFFMLAIPKRYRSEALYPELFKQPEDYTFEQSSAYAYAVYDKGELSKHINDYGFPIVLKPTDIPKDEFTIKYNNGASELWYKATGDKIIVIARHSNFILEAITLFAYLFCAFLFLVAIFQLASLIIRSGFRWRAFKEMWQFNIKSQIYSTIIFVSVFSFIVVGAATIIFFINRYDKNNRDVLSRNIQMMAGELKSHISQYRLNADGYQIYDSATQQLQKDIGYIAELHNYDVNLYNPDGTLQISSQPFVYNKGVLSRMMDPVAFYNLSDLRKIQFVQDEKYGQITYLSIYMPVISEEGVTEAYLNIPYFNSHSNLNQEISTFLVTIINLNAFIFLIAGVIALFLTNRITDSFTLIGDMMKEVNLGQHNEEIVWKRKDEIGGLVKEYNKMVQKLEESAVALAKTEREGAWREMARQVAHEIKNPLTPMKLSIQYLQKAIDNNAPNVKELSSNVAQTLIEQIDHLSKIAADFSQFANIGNVKNEVFDLNQMMQSLISLQDSREGVDIKWNADPHPIIINADKTQMNRLFTNLFQNAVEAIPETKRGVIDVEEKKNGHTVLISIKDNGSGIPVDTQSKIFTPNFTTKTSGTGLGLAMCKSIVEQAKGKIWFETAYGRGTTFYVELQLYDKHLEV
ncbi:MAG: histidine kinase [Bacteroidetes bacterium]|nr:MAG: histidine kinase [Bacteroidota bacterium]